MQGDERKIVPGNSVGFKAREPSWVEASQVSVMRKSFALIILPGVILSLASGFFILGYLRRRKEDGWRGYSTVTKLVIGIHALLGVNAALLNVALPMLFLFLTLLAMWLAYCFTVQPVSFADWEKEAAQ